MNSIDLLRVCSLQIDNSITCPIIVFIGLHKRSVLRNCDVGLGVPHHYALSNQVGSYLEAWLQLLEQTDQSIP